MKATTHRMAEAITLALGPIFHAQPDYKTICEAMALTVARVAQSTQDRGFEHQQLDKMYSMASHALTVFLNEEEAIQEAKAKVLAKGIDGFAEMYGPANGLAAVNGGVSPEACAEAEEFAGKVGWENSPIHEEIARFERENQDLQPNCCKPGYNPDGPRAYLP